MATKKKTLAPVAAAEVVAPVAAPVVPVLPSLPAAPVLPSAVGADLASAVSDGVAARGSLVAAVAAVDNAFWLLPQSHAVRVGRAAAVDVLKSRGEYLESVILTLGAQSKKAGDCLTVAEANLRTAYDSLESENVALESMIADCGGDIGEALTDYEREEKSYLLAVAAYDEQCASVGLLVGSWGSALSKVADTVTGLEIETATLKKAGEVVMAESEDSQAVKAIEAIQASVMRAELGVEESSEVVEIGSFHIPQSLVVAMRASVRLFDTAEDALRSIGDRLYRVGVRASDFNSKEFRAGIYKQVLIALLDSHSLSLYQLKPTSAAGKDGRQAVVDRLKASYGALQRAVARTENAGKGKKNSTVSFPVRFKQQIVELAEKLQKYNPKNGDVVIDVPAISLALSELLSKYLSGVDASTAVAEDSEDEDRIGLDD